MDRFKPLFGFLILLLMFASCDEQEMTSEGFLPSSSGMADEVIIVGDPVLWKKGFEEAFKDEFYKMYPILPQFEPTVRFSFVPFDQFSRLFKRHRNIIFLADLSSNAQVSEFVSKSLGDEYTAKALNDTDFFFALKRDMWAKPQMLMFVFGSNEEELMANVKKNGYKLSDQILSNDLIHKYLAVQKAGEENYEIESILESELKIDMRIPKGYFVAKQDSSMLWIRQETDDVSANLFFKIVSLDSFTNQPYAGVDMRNELGKFVESGAKGAYMISDTILPFKVRSVYLNGYEAIDTRGLWRMQGDFMGGPFVNYLILDQKNNRVVMLDGWVFSPKVKKKPQIRALEATLSTFSIPGSPASKGVTE